MSGGVRCRRVLRSADDLAANSDRRGGSLRHGSGRNMSRRTLLSRRAGREREEVAA